MTHILGWTGLTGVALLTVVLAYRYRLIAHALVIAFAVRLTAALVHFYITPLPDGTMDAVAFERYAREWSQDGVISALIHFPGMDSYFYSWLIALLFALTDQSLLLMQSTSVLVGVMGVVATYLLAREVWNSRVGIRAAWVMALFPTVVQYGALPMREAWFVLFFLLGALAAVRWYRHRALRYIVWATISFLIGAMFHGGAAVALFAFYGVIAGDAIGRLASSLRRYRVRVLAGLALIVVTAIGATYVVSGVSIPKLGTATEMVSAERWMHYFEVYHRGDARYPVWTQPQNAADFVWAVPVRAVYLLASPFPWDVDSPRQLLGLVDAVFYWALLFLLIRHRKEIWSNQAARMLLLILAPVVLAFGIGVANFGAAIRHRAKFVALIIVMVSPFIPHVRVWLRRLRPAPISRGHA